MNTAIHLIKGSEIRRVGTEALIKALGPIGMARYLEEYDNGGAGPACLLLCLPLWSQYEKKCMLKENEE